MVEPRIEDVVTTQMVLQALNSKGKPPAMPAMEGVNTIQKGFGNAMEGLYRLVEKRTKEPFPPAKDWSNQDAKDSLSLGPAMNLPLFRGYGLGVGGGKGSGGRFSWDKAKPFFERNFTKNSEGRYPSDKELISKFRARFPEYSGGDANIRTYIQKFMNTQNISPRINYPVKEPIPLESLDWLTKNQPVNEQWLKSWAKDAGVPTKFRGGSGATMYSELTPENAPMSGVNPTVRMPVDKNKHVSTRMSPNSAGTFFDTGTGLPPPHLMDKIVPETLINKSNMSFAHPEALDAALKYTLHKAPTPARYGQPGNWLIPEEMAPKGPPKASQAPEVPGVLRPDPNQLILRLLLE